MGEPITESNAKKCKEIAWQDCLNCYSFAANCKEPLGNGALACHPGSKAGSPLTAANLAGTNGAKALWDACIADGFKDASNGVLGVLGTPPACDKKHYLVAVFVDRHTEKPSYHFARQGEPKWFGGREWAHKPSAAQPAVNFAYEHLLGDDPSNVPWSKAGKMDFVGYLKAPLDGVAVKKGDWG